MTILESFSHGGACMPNLESLLCLKLGKKVWGGVGWVGWVRKPILVLSFGPRFGLKISKLAGHYHSSKIVEPPTQLNCVVHWYTSK